jgi:hypothetical protein
MTTIRFRATDEECAAINEYANMCGEKTTTLVRKIVIQEITFMKNRSTKDPASYEYHMLVPDGISDKEEKKLIEANYNKIRKILGWGKINLS